MIAEVRRVVAASSASDADPTSTWELARELAFRSDTPTAPRLRALAFLLDNPSPPPELSEFEREIRTWSLEQIDAGLVRLSTADDDGRLGRRRLLARQDPSTSRVRSIRARGRRKPDDCALECCS